MQIYRQNISFIKVKNLKKYFMNYRNYSFLARHSLAGVTGLIFGTTWFVIHRSRDWKHRVALRPHLSPPP
jgi:hypothetical protein